MPYDCLLLTNQWLFLNNILIKHYFMAAKEYDYMLKSKWENGISMLKYKMSDLFYFILSIWFFNLPWVDKLSNVPKKVSCVSICIDLF